MKKSSRSIDIAISRAFLKKQALAEPHRTYTSQADMEENEIGRLPVALKEAIKSELVKNTA